LPKSTPGWVSAGFAFDHIPTLKRRTEFSPSRRLCTRRNYRPKNRELVGLQPDILVGHSTPSAKGLLKQTHTIPIVFLTVTVFEVSLGTPNGFRFSSRLYLVFGESPQCSTPRPRPITAYICNRLMQARAIIGDSVKKLPVAASAAIAMPAERTR
jgi:hypothetical protein